MDTVTLDKTTVKYDRPTRQWQAVNGRVLTFPAGPDGKRQALLAALEHDHPALYEIVSGFIRKWGDIPGVTDRAIKAAQLIAHGHVIGDGNVLSQTEPGLVYSVEHSPVYTCDCVDHLDGHAPEVPGHGRMCKHCLADHLYFFVDGER